MKRLSFIIFILSFSVALFAKDIKTLVVTTLPQMHCASCENKIKGNLRFEKGIKQIECDIPKQIVTITYDAEKTNTETIIKSFGKFGYKATEVKQDGKKEDGKNGK
jgi:copper chaperone CopZ